MQWRVLFHDRAVDELDRLPVALKARMVRLLEMVEGIGLERMGEPHVKNLGGKLWELRAKAPGGVARGIYVTRSGRRVVVLHVFEKKSQKTPGRALDLAAARMKEVPE